MNLPAQVNQAMDLIENSGYTAYVVGGFVRDSLLNVTPKDWDLCASALPEQIMDIFHDYKIIPTGLKHGTVTVVIDHIHLEITTFRVDGQYTDNRHPDRVLFTSNIEEDLARRDFTINAMAYNPKVGLVDPFGGRRDLEEQKIRCVGTADNRFKEDALRIMRGLRFASVLGFSIEEETSEAMHRDGYLLKNIAMERVNEELSKFIKGNVYDLLISYRDVFAEVIPEIKPCFNFDQHNYHHIYNVWEHIAKSVEAAPKDEIIRFAMLFHDIGKPVVFTLDDDGVGHFYGHGAVSEGIAREVLNRLRFDKLRKNSILKLIKHHDVLLTGEKNQIKRLMNKLGELDVKRLLQVKKADTLAQASAFHVERLALIDKACKQYEEIIEENQCFTIKDLELDGKDLIKAGYGQGPEIGKLLKEALDAVINEKVSNKKYELLSFLDKSNKK